MLGTPPLLSHKSGRGLSEWSCQVDRSDVPRRGKGRVPRLLSAYSRSQDHILSRSYFFDHSHTHAYTLHTSHTFAHTQHPHAHARVQTFACTDGIGEVPREQINDDYCDCLDGSDEPGTAACSQQGAARFYCINKGHRGAYLFSSRVNDGLCDCCDGSDEWDSPTKCQNTCAALNEAWLLANAEQIRLLEAGAEIKKEYVAEGQQAMNEQRSAAARLKVELAEHESLVEGLREKSEAESALEVEERAASATARNLEVRRRLRLTELDTGALQDVIMELTKRADAGQHLVDIMKGKVKDGDMPLPSPEAIEAELARTTEAAGATDADAAAADATKAQSDAEMLAMATAELEAAIGEVGAEAEDASVVAAAVKESADAVAAALAVGEASDADGGDSADSGNRGDEVDSGDLDIVATEIPADTEAAVAEPLPTPGEEAMTLLEGLEGGEVERPEAVEARKKLQDVETDVLTTRRKMDEANEDLEDNKFGKDMEFYHLKGKCFSVTSQGYTYEMCPYGSAKQGHVSLGSFSWDNGGKEGEEPVGGDAAAGTGEGSRSGRGRPLVMKFAGGEHCWNGPARSLTVRLECGTTNELKQISEPAICEYAGVFSSPAACDLAHAQGLKMDLMEDEQADGAQAEAAPKEEL